MILKAGINQVLIALSEEFRATANGNMAVGGHHDRMKDANVYGEVVAVPEYLYYDCRMNGLLSVLPTDPHWHLRDAMAREYEFTMPWVTRMELKKGDTVIFKYIHHISGYEEATIFEWGDQWVVAVPYSDIYCIVNEGEDPRPLNGYILVEPLQHEVHTEYNDFMAIQLDRKEKAGQGIIRFIGSFETNGGAWGFWDESHVNRNANMVWLSEQEYDRPKVGQKITYRKYLPPIEYKYHQRLNAGDTPLVRVQAPDILAYME
jgi:hypothetical protein